jgi:signal transduction histidine kinase/CheY-like chemotaxis protein/HPt (histidine-containing phosphotransfer) domain-containing protein
VAAAEGRLLATGLFAVIELDAAGRVVASAGAPAGGVRVGERGEDALPFLVGLDAELAEIGAGRSSGLHLPHLAWPAAGGAERFVSLHLLPGGAPGGVTLLLADTTEISLLRRQVMQQRNELALARSALDRTNRALAEERDRAEEATRAKSHFLAVMSHEIRTSLNGVLGSLELLADADLPGEAADWARTATGSAEALLEILNDVLDYSKIEGGHIDLEQLAFDPRGVADDVVRLLTPLARSKGIGLAASAAAGVPEGVSGDPSRLRQVLLNLVGNAIKFTAVGGVELRLSGGGAVPLRVEVEDSGIGIEPEAQARLFQEFSQTEASTARRFGGSGLGLAICKRLVEHMGGRIGVHSQAGSGSTFWFELPLPRAEVEPAGGPAERARPAAPVRGARVLLVDDSETNRGVAGAMLRRAGYEVGVAAGGREAIAAVREGGYALVLMDLNMPEMDGFQATAAIRALGAEGRLPVVAMTANAASEIGRDLRAAGFDAYLAKPIVRRTLLDTIGDLLAAAPSAPAAAPPPAPAAGAALLDPAVLESLAEGVGAEALPPLLETFRREIRGWVDALPDELAGGRLDVVERYAHNIKSCAGSVGAHALAGAAEVLERAARAGDAAAAGVGLRALAPLAEAALSALAEAVGEP